VILLLVILALGILSGATATVAGFGIGSILTPVLATRYSMPLAIAAVSIPHAIATALRCWRLRASISWPVIKSFGVLSAVGGLTGALLYLQFSSHVLTLLLGALLIATSIAALTNWLGHLHPTGMAAQTLGFVSGLFGGVAGNQGGLRAAALLAFGLSPAAFVATATATGLAVDAARMPIYIWHAGDALVALAAPIGVATVGVVIGTVLGERMLFGLPPDKFRRVVGVLIGILGLWLVSR
jgi:uncharacterized protein